MPPKHPYTHEAEKGNFLGFLDNGFDIVPAAKKAKINIKTAREIKKHADKVTVFCDENSLPPPLLHDRTIIVLKSGRPRALTELNINQLDIAISQDCRYHEIPQIEVAEELDIYISKIYICNTTRDFNYHRVKPTKKLALIPIQEAIRYKIVLLQKDWILEDWKRVLFSDKASILVGEYRGRYKISRKPEEKYNPDCIEVRYNNYTEAIF
jgi:hypothetical protein